MIFYFMTYLSELLYEVFLYVEKEKLTAVATATIMPHKEGKTVDTRPLKTKILISLLINSSKKTTHDLIIISVYTQHRTMILNKPLLSQL